MRRRPVGQAPEGPEAAAVLLQRAERLATPRAPGEDEATWVGEFRLSDARHALPLASLLAAVPLRRVAPVPLAPPQVLGVVRFEGQVLTVYSLASLLETRGWRQDPAVLLIVQVGDRRVGLDCEQVPRPLSLPRQSLEAGAHAPGASRTVLDATGAPLQLLDLARLLPAPGAR